MRAKITLLMVGLVGLGLPVLAATIPVTTTDPAVAADGQCSLIEAIVNANADAATHADCPAGSGADTIELASSALYVLDQDRISFYGPNGLPIVTSTITVDGHDSTIRRAPTAPAFRIFVVSASGTLALNDVTLEGGDSGPTYCGGALFNAFGSAVLTRTTVTGSTAPGGGGICNSSGPMTLTDCTVSFNTGSAGIGGIVNAAEVGDATMVIERSLITGNQAIDSGGGGIYSVGVGSWQAELHVTGSVISDNTAESSGGGLRSNQSLVTIEDSTIDGNHADVFCGGIFIEGGEGIINRTTISNNVVKNTAGFGTGGGICAADNTTTISNSTISGNLVLGPSTGGSFSGSGGGLSVVGGAYGNIPTVDTVVVVEDSTICDNTADVTGGGISAFRYGRRGRASKHHRRREPRGGRCGPRQLRRSITGDRLVPRLQPRR